MKKIGINMLAIPPKMAGTGIYIYNLLSALVDHDDDIEYVVFINKELVSDFPVSDKIVYKVFNIKGLIKRVLIEQLIIPFYSFKFYTLHAVANVAPLFSFCPVVTTIHDIYQLYYPERFPLIKLLYLKYLVPLSIWKSQTVITVSECTKSDIEKHYSFFSKKTKLTSIPEASRYDIRDRTKGPENFLLFVGTLEPGKNLKTLLEAFSLLPTDIKRNFPLKIVGGRGWKDSDIKKVVDKLEVQPYIKFLGYISDDDLKELYFNATCFILPSLYEGFGLPVLEAMSQGCPVITSNVSSLPEVSGDAAILVDPMDANELYEALENLIRNKDVQELLTVKGYEQVQKFSWKCCAEKTKEEYNVFIQ